jgi:hypothetical protein
MYLKTLSIKNFRALADIQIEFNKLVNVIVGPNAIGKTTILEAIKLVKALLAPRTLSEPTQALIALGAASPHNPQNLFPEAIARDRNQPIHIRCGFQFVPTEVQAIERAVPQIVTNMVQVRMGANTNPAAFTAFLSSPPGQETLRQADVELRAGIERIKQANWICHLRAPRKIAPFVNMCESDV